MGRGAVALAGAGPGFPGLVRGALGPVPARVPCQAWRRGDRAGMSVLAGPVLGVGLGWWPQPEPVHQPPGVGEVGRRARCRDLSRPSPAGPLPHPACASQRTGRSACLARWSATCRGGCRCRGPWGRYFAAAIAVAVTVTLAAPVNTTPCQANLHPVLGLAHRGAAHRPPPERGQGRRRLLRLPVPGPATPPPVPARHDRASDGRRAGDRRARSPGTATRPSSTSAPPKDACPVQLALRHPHLTGGGFDLPAVGPIFNDYVAAHGLADRLRFYPGDFFADPLPARRRR